MFRVALAAAVLTLCLRDWAAMRAREAMAALPSVNYGLQAEALLAEQRYSEALLVVQSGLNSVENPADYQRLVQLRSRIETERSSWGRRLREAAQGAVTGRGETMEALAGAVVADLFVFGDLRDLTIEGAHAVTGEPVDEVLVALSGAGLLLTAVPAADLGTAVLKFARRLGALGEDLAQAILRMARQATDERRFGPLLEVTRDTARLEQRMGPAPTLRLMRTFKQPADIASVARFAERPGGAYALWVGGTPVVAAVREGDTAAAALYLRAARKGVPGVQFAQRHAAELLRVHPMLGLLKGLYKGNVPLLLGEWLSRHSAALIGLSLAWLTYECLLLLVRTLRLPRREKPAPPLRHTPGI